MNDSDTDSSMLTSPGRLLLRVFGVLLLTIVAVLLMELPMLDPRAPNPFFLAVLWSVGLFAWALRAVRSHRSQLRTSTVLIFITFCVVGFWTNILIPLTAVCVAMIADLGVARTKPRRADYFWRSIQGLAGITGLAHAGRMTYYTFWG